MDKRDYFIKLDNISRMVYTGFMNQRETLLTINSNNKENIDNDFYNQLFNLYKYNLIFISKLKRDLSVKLDGELVIMLNDLVERNDIILDVLNEMI